MKLGFEEKERGKAKSSTLLSLSDNKIFDYLLFSSLESSGPVMASAGRRRRHDNLRKQTKSLKMCWEIIYMRQGCHATATVSNLTKGASFIGFVPAYIRFGSMETRVRMCAQRNRCRTIKYVHVHWLSSDRIIIWFENIKPKNVFAIFHPAANRLKSVCDSCCCHYSRSQHPHSLTHTSASIYQFAHINWLQTRHPVDVCVCIGGVSACSDRNKIHVTPSVNLPF